MSARDAIEFHVRGSGADPYQVIFTARPEGVYATCTCKAGIFGEWCKHRQAILDGKLDLAVDASPESAAIVRDWFGGSPLDRLLRMRIGIDAEIRALKKRKLDALKPTIRVWTKPQEEKTT